MATGTEAKFLAFDMGAESGRALVGLFDGQRVKLEEAHRFPTGGTRAGGTLFWDVLRLWDEVKHGLRAAVSIHGSELAGMGVDTWGVDFGLLGRGDVLLGNPRHYRDHANAAMPDAAFQIVPRERIFERTGIQFMQINTLYQLLALQRERSPLLDCAETLLMIPDLLNFFLTGEKVSEYTIASTSQIADPRARAWATDLLTDFGLPGGLLTPLVEPGTRIGTLRADVAEETGSGRTNIYAPGEHDTASAVVAVPAETANYAYLSSGTWSLLGVEVHTPRISPETLAANFTNEGGCCGTTRLLKNIMGLWLVQECRRSWTRRGQEFSYADLTAQAAAATPLVSLIEPDAPAFLAPADMTAAIAEFCRQTGQTEPSDVGATVRCCLESLALKYRWALETLATFRGQPIETLHIVGGGTQNRLLCQFAADATGRTVIAGPVEATATGNVLMQALGRGMLSSLEEARQVVRASFALETYTPSANRASWEEAYARFLTIRDRLGKQD